MREPRHPEEKLEELILYVSAKMARDRHRGPGRIKLAKLLFLIDFEAYRRFGRSVSGAHYTADKLGPAPTEELMATRDLESRGHFEWQPGFDRQQLPTARREADVELFSDREMDLVDEIVDRYRTWTSKQLVELAHDFMGWKVKELGEPVPYYSVYMPETGPNEEDIRWAQITAREHGW